jgi:hypothetical protein
MLSNVVERACLALIHPIWPYHRLVSSLQHVIKKEKRHTLERSRMGTLFSTSSPSKLIFLDINVVANSSQATLMDDEEILLIRLHQLVRDVPGSALVLSGAWRLKENDRNTVRDYLTDQGIPHFISCTPNLGTGRMEEILWWLAVNTDYLDKRGECGTVIRLIKGPKSRFPLDLPQSEYALGEMLEGVTHFVVIDDMEMAEEKSEFAYLVLSHSVHVNKKVGLRQEDVENAIRVLSR